MKKTLLALLISTTLAGAAFAHAGHDTNPALETYAKIAEMNYNDALTDAKQLQAAIHAFTKNPTKQTLQAAKDAWLVSRESYGTTEIYRLSEGPIDAEEGWVAEAYGNLEGQLNAWPLDEFMIDYTIDAEGKRTSGNIIDTKGKFTPGGEDAVAVDVTVITPKALTELNEDGGEENVSTGYHAIEFLLWGQDQDYSNFVKDNVTKGAMVAGQRPLTDFTTDKNAERRKTYLNAAADKIVDDLALVASAWDPKVDGNKGLYRSALLGQDGDKNIDEKTAIKQITGGMGMFIKSELANERVAVAVLTPSEEDEHSCFSDNTHRDLVKNYEGFKNALLGTYKGKKVGPSLLDKASPEVQKEIKALIEKIDAQVAKVDEIAKTKAHFDYQIQPGSGYEKNIVSMKNNMRKLGDEMIKIAKANGVSLTEEDVTDAEETKL
ncbi:MAG: imelysin [Gammaproteobacteria bacterium]|nr:MAG: imelysin [Gammaproteobacteria bacterium]